MPVIETHNLREGDHSAFGHQIYNGLDSAITLEVFEAVTRLSNQEPEIYSFERAMQAPAMDMMLRGWKIDQFRRRQGQENLRGRIKKLEARLNSMAGAVWGRDLNPRSSDQLIKFFYETMKLPEQYIYQKGQKKVSMNRETLEKLELYLYARPIISTILEIRNLSKKLEVLDTAIDPDNRMRSGYNIAGTETGRWSESGSAFDTGRNRQNIDPTQRDMFVADEGYKICGIDLEQAESREVGLIHGVLFNDWRYLDACEAGDLHTHTCTLIWRELGWSESDRRANRLIADEKFYREFSYRDMAKRGGHLTNYMGTAFTAARHLKTAQRVMEDFQAAYHSAYPSFHRWHTWVAGQLQTKGYLTTPFGRTRHFFGRANDDTTIREGIAYVPQSSTADRLNLALWRMWRYLPEIQLLAQVHDAVYFQYLDRGGDYEADIISRALALINTPMTFKGRLFNVPGEAKVGWNWASRSVDKATGKVTNPDGLDKWKGKDTRTRTSIMRIIL